jgi:RsiW-degrading membrane proteinase PrsW (M82 family)
VEAADQWYYLDGSHTSGPVPAAEIAQLIRSGTLGASTQVAQAGGQTWSPASVALAVWLQSAASRPQAPPLEPTFAIRLQCVSGPDQGKAYMIGLAETSLGRNAGVGAYDPLVADNHLILSWQSNVLYFRCIGGAVIRVAGANVTQGALSNGQQFQLGASVWQVGAAAVEVSGFLGTLSDRLRQLASTDKLEGFSLREMFSEVFKNRRPGELEEYLIAGTEKTTPQVEDVQTGWPKPWLFLRVLLFLSVVYLAWAITFEFFPQISSHVIPGMLVFGAMSVPLAVLVLFWELNTPRNVTFLRALMAFCLGGAIAFFFSIFGVDNTALGWVRAFNTGIIEETCKLAAVFVFVGRPQPKYLLNGILFGAAVGAGFGAFETAGYAFYDGYTQKLLTAMSSGATANIIPNAYDAMVKELWGRTFVAPFMHVVWTAIAAGALWRAKGLAPLRFKDLIEPTFIRTFFIAVILHVLWDSPLILKNWTGVLEEIGLGVIAYAVGFGLVQQGLKQVRAEQLESARAALHQSQEILTTSGRFRAQHGA